MHIYIIMLIISLVFAFVSEKKQKKCIKITFEILSIIPFIIVSAIRFDVGTDYLYRYASDFETIRLGGNVHNIEILFKIIIKICIFLFNDYESLFIVTTLIIIPIIMHIIFKYSKKPTLSIFIFFSGCYFFHSLNAIRQYIAISLILLAYKNVLYNSYKRFILIAIIAFFIHYTSIVCIIALFLRKRIIVNPVVLITLVSITLIFSNQISNFFDFCISKTYYNVYVNSSYNVGDLNNSAFILNFIVYIIFYAVYKKYKVIDDKKIAFFINMQGIAILLIAMGAVMSLANRISFYFSILQIISIPYVMYYVEINKNNVLEKKLLMCIIIILYSTNLIYNNVINNVDEVLPYKTIFNKYNS